MNVRPPFSELMISLIKTLFFTPFVINYKNTVVASLTVVCRVVLLVSTPVIP